MTRHNVAVIVGAGFAGLYMLHKLRESGVRARLIEAGGDVGGAWYWNRYPGLRCDVESLDYQFQFSDDLEAGWNWPERYSEGPVIRKYFAYVADRLDLRRDISFNTRVDSAAFDEAANLWRIGTDQGETIDASWFILAVGPLTTVNTPQFEGMESFRGRILHTARWPEEEVDFAGRRVAVIGTGSSGIQCTPVIAGQAAQLTVFQRTPAFSLPSANRAVTPEEQAAAHARFPADRDYRYASAGGMVLSPNAQSALEVTDEEREAEFERRWTSGGFGFLLSYRDLLTSAEANAVAVNFVKRKIRAKVNDPYTAAALTRQDYPLGAKRPCIDSGFYETFNLPHVKLVDAMEAPIERFCSEGIVAGGTTYPVDDIVLATGFDAVTGAVLKIRIAGRGGLTMNEAWKEGPHTYLGLAVAGFPNMLILDGAQSPSVIVNAPIVIEQQVRWVDRLIEHVRTNGIARFEATEQAQADWVRHVGEIAQYTLYPKADSWAMGANIPGKPRVMLFYLAGLEAYGKHCADCAGNDYHGFKMERAAELAGA